ncbi:MAG: hypothetical protein IPJ41_01480 [Phycisphaerales bacterium]|nr:hypothetical protein [Phycisphaerales bacterium]
MPGTLAYFITWSTYGAHLHGDDRGSVDRSGSHGPGRPLIVANPGRERFELTELRHEVVSLDEKRRAVVEKTIRAHVEYRRWSLLALHIRRQHLHMVARAPETPEKVMGECKAWCTRRLREAGLAGPTQKIWARHGSTRYLFNEDSLRRAIRYVQDEQGEPLDG